jgi:hypothetical protein
MVTAVAALSLFGESLSPELEDEVLFDSGSGTRHLPQLLVLP